MLKWIVSGLVLLVAILAVFVVLLLILPKYFGAFQLKDAQRLLDVVILGAATFAGVMSNSIYDRVVAGKLSGNVFRRRDVVLASIVAPIVMLPIYQTLQTGSDVVILALTSYQNGFFFNTWFNKLTEQKNEK